MTERKLTPDEIEYLYTFIELRNVKYYDVQMELVDHLASAIEQKWETDPELSFDEAVRNEQRQFNHNDFEQILEEKEEALRRKYRKIEHHYIADFFSWPKIVATSFVTLLIYQIFPLFVNYFRFVSFVILADILIVAFLAYIVYPRKYEVDLKEDKEFLLLQQLKSGQHYFLGVGRLPASILMVFLFTYRETHFSFVDHPVFKVIVALLISMSAIFILATGFYVPNRMKEDFCNQFPQFVKSGNHE